MILRFHDNEYVGSHNHVQRGQTQKLITQIPESLPSRLSCICFTISSQSPFQFCFVGVCFGLVLDMCISHTPSILHFVSLMGRCSPLHVSTVTSGDSLLGVQVLLDCIKYKSNLDLLSLLVRSVSCNISKCVHV